MSIFFHTGRGRVPQLFVSCGCQVFEKHNLDMRMSRCRGVGKFGWGGL